MKGLKKKTNFKTAPILFTTVLGIVLIIIGFLYYRAQGRLQIQFDIHQNKEAIYLSTFAEPPQFAIWIENPKTKESKTVFVTNRVSIGDWEGKANVPVALPRWYELFKVKKQEKKNKVDKEETLAVTGATPKDDFFSVRIEVPPGSDWICWIEMNLSGDFNEAYPEFNEQTLVEDEFSCGQPALLYRAEINAVDGIIAEPKLAGQSIWENGINRVDPVSEGVTTAKTVFDKMKISVMKPKIKLIENEIES